MPIGKVTMTDAMPPDHIICGFLPSFKGKDTVLLLSDPAGMSRLRDALGIFLSRRTAELSFLRLGFVHFRDLGDLIMIRRTASDLGIEIVKMENNLLHWQVSGVELERIVDKLAGLSAHDGPAHSYLEASGEAQVIASIGEYSVNVFDV